ncbi:hypothetical protein GI374_13470, partial [Paracoccus sp. S-4012]|nr:hypothetical protein [Paracoccus sp. S-4012]
MDELEGKEFDMPLDDTAPGLDALLLGTALELELSDRDHRVAEKRYQLIPEHLQRPASRLRPYMDDAFVNAQGSRAIGATIIDGATDDRFDLDAILEFRRPRDWPISDVLDELFTAVDFHPELTRVFHREVTHLQLCGWVHVWVKAWALSVFFRV